MIWDESHWMFKVATTFPKLVFDVRHSETGDSLAEATIQINDENSTALATFKGRPFQTFRGMELMSSDHKALGHIKIVIKPMSCPGQAISDPAGESIGRVEWEGTMTARLSVSEKHAQDIAMKKIIFGVFFGCQMLRAW